MTTEANTNAGKSTYTQVLTTSSFKYLWFGQICSQLAANTLLFVLALRIYNVTNSNTAVSGLFLAYGIPAVLFGMIAGTAVDRLDKRRVLIVCDLVRAFLTVGLLFLSHQVIVVYLVTLINALITQFYVPSEAPLIPRIIPKHLLVSANSLFSFTFYSSLAVGTILAGPLLRIFGPQGVFLFIAALFAAASALSSRIPTQSAGTVGLRNILGYDFRYIFFRIRHNLFEGIHYVRRSKSLFDSIILLTGTQIIMALLGALGPGFADKVLHIDIRDASLLIVAPAVVGILAGVVWVGTIGYKHHPMRLINIGVNSAGWVLIMVAVISRLLRVPSFAWLYEAHIVLPIMVVLFFLLGVSNSFLDVPANAILQDQAQGSLHGRIYGMLAAFVGGVGILPVVISGVLADTVGIAKVIFILGAGIAAYGLFRVRYNKV